MSLDIITKPTTSELLRAVASVCAAKRASEVTPLDVEAIRQWDPAGDVTAIFSRARRWLCRGHSFLLSSGTGCGKSSLLVQLCVALAAKIPFAGFDGVSEMTVLYLQSENNGGDFWEALKGAVLWASKESGKSQDEIWALVRKNFRAVALRKPASIPSTFDCPVRKGTAFCNKLRMVYSECAADVVLIDPLTSYFE